MAKKKQIQPTTAAPVSSYKHEGTRARIPTQEESVKLSARDKQPIKKTYEYDPSLDPQLVWAGKKEQGSELAVPTVPIYVQEKIAPEGIIARMKLSSQEEQSSQGLLFGETAYDQATKSVDFYKHEDNWQNRMILGDSLLVMNSLLEKEGLRGRVQTVFIDPPYGIKFGSNWQVSTRKRDVKDNKLEDFVRQPEQIKAFRDTWELGIHSYLSYIRDRLITVRELLTESGSCFVQINDENSHLLRNILDEVFGSDNFVCEIVYKKKGMMLGSKYLESMNDYILWYGKNKDKTKYNVLYEKTEFEPGSRWDMIELSNKERRSLSQQEKNGSALPSDSKLFDLFPLRAPSYSEKSVFDFELNGTTYTPKNGSCWITSKEKMEYLKSINRLYAQGKDIFYVQYLEDFPYKKLSNLWLDSRQTEKIYVVQTATKILEKCILMTSNPGDIILDPTCGSGTSAYVAEQWGRKWVTIDTSRVSLALARTRLMTAKFPYYVLNDEYSTAAGFEYKIVSHVTMRSLANNEAAEQETLYDEPYENKNVVRVTGPFTVESLSPHRVSDAQEMVSSERFVETVVGNLLKSGVQTGEKSARVEFENLDILPSGPEVQAIGEYKTIEGLKKVAVSIGPEFGSVDDDFIRDATVVASKFASLLIVAATSFEASAFSENAVSGGVQIMKVKINPDLSMGDLLKKTGSGNLFIAFGEPEVKIQETKDGITVEVVGVDVYDPVKSEIRSSGSGDPQHEIAAWFIDTNYNGDAFFVTHAYFLGADKPYEKLKKALKSDINEEVWEQLYSTISRPFAKPTTGKIAVKVINHYGDEVMKVINI